MSEPRSPLARRVAVAHIVQSADTIDSPDYASAFEIATADAGAHSAQQWARRTFEGAPTALREFVVFGWTTVLRLKLEPRTSPNAVLGWTIVASTPGTVTLEVRSPLITASKVVEVGPTRVRMTTFVQYERRLGRVIWSALAPVHHLTEPLLLTLAARRPRPGSQ